MAALRTQIYLTAEQRKRLDSLATGEGRSLADVIRSAVDQYLEQVSPDTEAALDGTFGTAPDFPDVDRGEWAEREDRIGG